MKEAVPGNNVKSVVALFNFFTCVLKFGPICKKLLVAMETKMAHSAHNVKIHIKIERGYLTLLTPGPSSFI